MSDTLSTRGLVVGFLESGLLSSSLASLSSCRAARFVSSPMVPGDDSYLIAVMVYPGVIEG